MMAVKEKRMNAFQGKHILVVGLARSGIGAASILAQLGARVSVTDSKPEQELLPHLALLPDTIPVYTGGCPDEIIDRADMLVISPGVPLYVPLVARAGERNIPVIGELELAYAVIQGMKDGGETDSPALPRFIGITGTNGKSTTTVLIDLMLRESGLSTLLGGNIGTALTEEVVRAGGLSSGEGSSLAALQYIVAEISSFQLESVKTFKPHIAAILNITADHLDRYAGLHDYAAAKARIYENQSPEDFLIVNADDRLLLQMVETMKRDRLGKHPRVLFFSRKAETDGIYLRENDLYINCDMLKSAGAKLPGMSGRSVLVSAEAIKIRGAHNIENAMAASLVSLLAGASLEAVKKVLGEFPGLEHRLEPVAVLKGVRFINDSKGTNVGAVAKSLEDLENVVLIMGGRDKSGDFSALRELVRKRVKSLILMGEAQDVIAEALAGTAETEKTSSLEEAVNRAAARASSGDVVLLSPGCTSFDMFRDFEERGRKFKEAVRNLHG
jgi:UDP-N-acetylmuramoylalanine--D-glutamate ligase